MSISLPLLPLATPGQRYSCHGCGACCRDFTVQLRIDDVKKLREQRWAERLGFDPIARFRGRDYLRQRADGACVFLLEDGKCRVHGEFGFENKPIACQLFPYMVSPGTSSARMGVSFACTSVVENKGELLNQQVPEALRIVSRGLGELLEPAPHGQIVRGTAAQRGELEALERYMVTWLASPLPLAIRLDGFAWMAQSLAVARIKSVRGDRFAELVELLTRALENELPHHPVGAPTSRQLALLRSAVFARTEDPKPLTAGAPGRVMATIDQLRRSRLWRKGRAASKVPLVFQQTRTVQQPMASAPSTSDDSRSAGCSFGDVEKVGPLGALCTDPECDSLLTRWLRATLEGGRAWGVGYYGWSGVDGIGAMAVSVAAVGWLSRAHAASHARTQVGLSDVRAALGRIDRTAGRAVWLGTTAERLRLAYLVRDDGLRAIIRSQFVQ